MQALLLVLFAITTGFTASGIAASLYRLSGLKAKSGRGQTVRLAVMAIAGPSVIFEYAVKGFKTKEWPAVMFWLVVGGVSYWCLALGLFIIDLTTHMA